MTFVKSLTLLILLTPHICASGNPFASADKKSDGPRMRSRPIFAGKIVSAIAPIQAKFNSRLSRLMKSAKEERSATALFMAVLISFVYGLIHAAGPGHGKTLLFSYFVAEGSSIKKGVAAAFAVMLMQAFSAIVIVSALYLTVRHSYTGSFEKFSNVIKLVSYALITAIGLGLLIKALFFRRAETNAGQQPVTADIRPLIFSIGIVPCPGVIILLIFAASLHFLYLGIFLAVIMALGMALTLSVVAVATITARKSLGLFMGSGGKSRKMEKLMELSGALLIFIFGGIFFIGSL
ncbi:MAG: hypothetical protein ABII20_07470 [Candidatus Omnitrophota bacterium]|nr:hypothetical protein [Candidatus Omnitrophota bacterium]MBU2527981.1 hypothetical protein [bacterium]MBU3930124.1 hypothetical protein [bacterium]MBU4122862.1 hypothetical protein [bacterium]